MIAPQTVSARPRSSLRPSRSPSPSPSGGRDARAGVGRPGGPFGRRRWRRRRSSTHRSRRSREGRTGTRRCLSVAVPCFNEAATVASHRSGGRVAVDGRGRGRRRWVERRHAQGARRLLDAPIRGCGDPPRAQPGQGRGAPHRLAPRRLASTWSSRTPTWSTTPPSTRCCWNRLERGVADVVFGSRFVTGRPHRVLYFWHSLGNRTLTLLSNMFTDLNLTDMETCYKCFRRGARGLHAREERFGIEPELTAKFAARRVAGVRGRDLLQRPHLRGGEEDRLEGRGAGLRVRDSLLPVLRRLSRRLGVRRQPR